MVVDGLGGDEFMARLEQ